MFKVFVLCTVLVTISGGSTDNQNVDKVAVAIENELVPQELSVPIEQILRAGLSESKNKDLPASACNARIDPDVEKQRIKELVQEVIQDEQQNENNRILLWLLAQKFTTTTKAPAMPPAMPPAAMPPAAMPPAAMPPAAMPPAMMPAAMMPAAMMPAAMMPAAMMPAAMMR